MDSNICIKRVSKSTEYPWLNCQVCGAKNDVEGGLFHLYLGGGAGAAVMCRTCMYALSQEILETLRGRLAEPMYAIVTGVDGMRVVECQYMREQSNGNIELVSKVNAITSTVYPFSAQDEGRCFFRSKAAAEEALVHWNQA